MAEATKVQMSEVGKDDPGDPLGIVLIGVAHESAPANRSRRAPKRMSAGPVPAVG